MNSRPALYLFRNFIYAVQRVQRARITDKGYALATVDGQGSTGTEIAGNNAVVNQDGTLDVSGGGHGIDITGDSATVDNKGGMTVTDPDSIGIQIDGAAIGFWS